ncbi:S4 domain-containing protein [Heyndrickxia sp. NPDC080065]|uniref:S4 domain-containing protein n=1 Tax=Heyndrickxia sp. NPDC080065 TaxID=3390568 RepID=UPI003D089BEC
MQTLELSWSLIHSTNDEVIVRYCKHCGKKVEFKDSLIRRHNSNGKNTYRYAIYKCEKDHTWNKKLSIYKAYTEHAIIKEEINDVGKEEIEIIDIESVAKQGISQICIKIIQASEGYRLDKLLAERVQNWNRSEIVKKIKNGRIQVNYEFCKPSQKIIENSIISVMLT